MWLWNDVRKVGSCRKSKGRPHTLEPRATKPIFKHFDLKLPSKANVRTARMPYTKV